VIRYGREFFQTHRVSRGAFQAALEQLGVQGLTELTMLMGYYGMLAFCVNAFDGDLPSERTSLSCRSKRGGRVPMGCGA